jgi:hypothetical protein
MRTMGQTNSSSAILQNKLNFRISYSPKTNDDRLNVMAYLSIMQGAAGSISARYKHLSVQTSDTPLLPFRG